MVVGLDKFKEHFAGYADRYILIGGSAAYLLSNELGLEFRATQDLDIVLTIEQLLRNIRMIFLSSTTFLAPEAYASPLQESRQTLKQLLT